MYYLVSDTVNIEPSSTKAKRVNMSNYTYTVRKGEYTPYNTVALRKIISGDTADNIPPLYSPYVNVYMSIEEDFSNFEKIRDLFRQYNDTDGVEHSYWVEPLTPIGVDLNISKPDLSRVKAWGVAFRNSNFMRHSNTGSNASIIDESINELVNKGLVVK